MQVDQILEDLQQRVLTASRQGTALNLCGGGSKSFYGRQPQGEALDLTPYNGIIAHEPSELVVTARAGTSLRELEQVLAEKQQMLAFEAPHFSENATLGGAVSSGLSGPRRAYCGPLRDFVLGVRCLNGRGEILTFGGQVMKNVAGFDLSRLMTGALGSLGILLEVSLKLAPMPAREITLVQDIDRARALSQLRSWAARPLPLSASAYLDNRLYLRLSGVESTLREAQSDMGGDVLDQAATFWQDLRDQRLDFFQTDRPLWRLSLPPATRTDDMPGESLMEWGGALHWLQSEESAESLFNYARAKGGHACLFRGGDRQGEVFSTLPEGMMKLHGQLKRAFDPHGIFNPGRLYASL